MEQNKLQIKEVIDSENNIIKGDQPIADTNTIKSTKTSDEINKMTTGRNNYYRGWFGTGYMCEGDSELSKNVVEQVLPIKEYDTSDVIDNTVTELPNIYKINNAQLVHKLKSLISILNADNNEIDKVAVFGDFINNIDFTGVSTIYKKLLVNKLKEKF